MTYFDKMSTTWSERYRSSRHFNKRLETALAWLESSPGQRLQVLDYGCGSGVLLRELLQRGHEVHGVDNSQGMIDRARNDLAEFPHVSLELITDSEYRGDYLASTYDVVYSLGVLEYVDNPRRLLAQLASVVKPGGFLIISVPNQRSVVRRMERFVYSHRPWFRGIRPLRAWTSEDSYLKFSKHQFTLAELDAILQPQGMVRRMHVYHVAPGPFRPIEHSSSIGATTIVKYQKKDD